MPADGAPRIDTRAKRGLEIAGESRFWIFRLGGLFVVLYNVYSHSVLIFCGLLYVQVLRCCGAL